MSETSVKELTQYTVDLQWVQAAKPGIGPYQFAKGIYANVFA